MKKTGMVFLRILSLTVICALLFTLSSLNRSHADIMVTPTDDSAPSDAGTEESSESSEDNKYTEMIDYIKNNIIPSVVAVISALGALYISVMPVISKVKNATECFGSATKDVRQSTLNYNESQRKIEECITKVEQMSKSCEREQQAVRKMLELAFCNSDELVSKGYAKRIAQIADAAKNGDELRGEEEDEGQNQTDNI